MQEKYLNVLATSSAEVWWRELFLTWDSSKISSLALEECSRLGTRSWGRSGKNH